MRSFAATVGACAKLARDRDRGGWRMSASWGTSDRFEGSPRWQATLRNEVARGQRAELPGRG